MNKPELFTRLPGARPSQQECCSEGRCDSGLRNNYFVGKRLTPDTFRTEQDYLNERRRLLNRAVHGWGVVYGFAVEVAPANACRNESASGRLRIGPGFALDAHGRELLQIEESTVSLADVIMTDAKGTPDERDPTAAADYGEGCWQLSAHYAEQSMAPVDIHDPCSCHRQEWDSVCETVRYSLRRIDCAECCAEAACELECACGEREGCGERFKTLGATALQAGDEACGPGMRGRGACLCDYVEALNPNPERTGLCTVEEPCARVRIALRDAVPLACVTLVLDDCKEWSFDTGIDSCGSRRLVKRNDLLFDLIRGCDLTRISAISWKAWHRGSVGLDAFKKFFGYPLRDKCNLTLFTVRFSKPVQAKTLKADCFSMAVMFHEKEGGWRERLQVPIDDVELKADAGGLTQEVALMVRTKWVNDAVRGDETRFDGHGARVEIEVRGDFILDCNGQAVDGNAVGLRDAPTGNGTPGGTFVSVFQVLSA